MKRLILVILFFYSCTKSKEYIQQPTCYRYLELSDKYDEEIRYIRTDTIYPNGVYNNVVCGEDVLKLENFKGDTVGCIGGGYQRFRYILIK